MNIMFFLTFILLLLGNWLLTTVLVFIPMGIIDRISYLSWWGVAVGSLLFLAWCLADD
ncbi:hypothetical protein [Myxosarcina sp. GI1(2024)]